MRSRKSASQAQPRKRHLVLRVVLILVIAGLCVYVLPSPWAFHIGGRFSPLGEWDGYGPVQAGHGPIYLLFTHLRGGLLNNHGHASCSFAGCDTLTGSAQLCTPGGQHHTFGLTGTVHSWYSTNGARTVLSLTGGAAKWVPGGASSFHGVWHRAVLPLTGTGGSPATVTLRPGSVPSFDHACRALAGQAR